MGLTKKSITISQDLYEATKNISDNFSSVVAAAIDVNRKIELTPFVI